MKRDQPLLFVAPASFHCLRLLDSFLRLAGFVGMDDKDGEHVNQVVGCGCLFVLLAAWGMFISVCTVGVMVACLALK